MRNFRKLQHIETWKSDHHFTDTFKCISVKEKVDQVDTQFTDICSKGPMNTTSALVRVLAYGLLGTKLRSMTPYGITMP